MTASTATQSPVSASSEFYGALCLQSSLCGRPKLQQHKEGGCETEEGDGATPRYDRTFSGNAVQFAMPKFRCPGGTSPRAPTPAVRPSTTRRSSTSSQVRRSSPWTTLAPPTTSCLEQVRYFIWTRATVGSQNFNKATPPVSPSAVVNVGVEAPPFVAAQLACLAPGLSSNANNIADSESTFIYSRQQPMIVQDASNVFKEMPVYDVYEEDATASQSCVHPTVDIIEAVNEELEVKVHGGKPIISPERPTDGIFSFTSEKKSDTDLLAACYNNASDNAFSEKATYLTFLHAPIVHADSSIMLTIEKSTQATSTLCIHEAIVHCHDVRPEHINCTNGTKPVPLKFEEDILISGVVSDVVNSKAWEFGSPPSHCINHVELRLFWDPGDHRILSSTVNRDILGVPSMSKQIYCKVPPSHENRGIQFEWDPGIFILMDMMLSKTAVPNMVHRSERPIKLLIFMEQPVDMKHFLSELLLQCQTWCHNLNVFPKVQSCCLPIVQCCPYSEPTQQLVCYASTFSSIEAIHSALSMSTARTVRMILALSYGKVAQEGRDQAAVYNVFILQLSMSTNSHIWYPGARNIVNMMLDKYTVLHQVQFVQRTSDISFLSLTTCIQYVAPKGTNSVRHATCFILRRAAHLTRDNYLSSLCCKSVLKTSCLGSWS